MFASLTTTNSLKLLSWGFPAEDPLPWGEAGRVGEEERERDRAGGGKEEVTSFPEFLMLGGGEEERERVRDLVATGGGKFGKEFPSFFPVVVVELEDFFIVAD